jgi:hypothetical protein
MDSEVERVNDAERWLQLSADAVLLSGLPLVDLVISQYGKWTTLLAK